jgi:hypothetical protein
MESMVGDESRAKKAREAGRGRFAREAESPRLECFTYHFFSPLRTF